MLSNYLKITWKVLQRKKIYTIVTLAGIIIPVTFIVLITSLLVHLNNYNPPKSGFKKVVHLDWVTWKEIKADGKTNQRQTNPPTYAFVEQYVKVLKTPKLAAAISAQPGVDIIYLNNKPNEVFVKYCDSELWQITNFNFLSGRPFNKVEFEQAAKVVVIDEKTSNTIFGSTDVIGKNLELKNKLFRVVGVVKNVDITMHRLAANIYMPFSCNEDYLSKTIYGNWANALVLMDRKNDHQKINSEFQQKLKTMSFEGKGPINHVEAALSQDNYIERIRTMAFTFFKFYGDVEKPLIVAGFLLFFFFIVLPAINLVNINLNRVYERLSEIGVRKTFGATTGKLVSQFLFENIIIIFLGGILSILLSSLIILYINKSDALSGIYLTLNFRAVIISLLGIFVLSILSGLMPSISMARAKIIQSLAKSE